MNCIRTDIKEFQELLEASKLPSLLLEMEISEFQDKNGLESYPKLEDIIKPNEVNQALKSIEILSSGKAKQIFDKGKKANWDLNKILTELQIPKEQKQLLLDLNITDREQLALELASNYSYTVEINTATRLTTTVENPFDHTEPMNTDYYSNLIVPGGTNYTENEIATPDITPSIKGHAEFATDNGIGWFRGDDQILSLSNLDNLGIIKKVPC